MLFRLHAIRSGCLARQTLPIQSPKFSAKTASGELSKAFMEIWKTTTDSLNDLTMYPVLPGFDSDASPAAGSPATTLSPTYGSPAANSPLGPAESSGQLMALKKKLSGYLRGSTPTAPADPNQSSSGAVDPSTPGTTPGTDSGPTPNRPSLPSMKHVTLEFCRVCQFDTEKMENNEHAARRYPFIQLTLLTKRRALKTRGLPGPSV